MAGEKKGITYEAILYVVLERLRKKGKLKGKVFWNETPDGMTIEPDLLVGPNKDHPTAMFLVTHSGSAKESEKKFWRNMGELVEAKTHLATVPRVYNVAFDSVIKESLKKVQAAAFDGQLLVGDKSYGTALQTWVDANNKSLPKDRFEKADAVKKVAAGKELSTFMAKLEADVAKLVSSTNARMNSIWALERKRPKGKAPEARETFVRRGLSKLLVFEDVELALRLYGRQKVEIDEVPKYIFDLGLAKRLIGGARGADPEVRTAVDCLGDSTVKLLLAEEQTPTLFHWLMSLRNLSHTRSMLCFMGERLTEFQDPAGLLRLLQRCHASPKQLLSGHAENNDVESNWVYHIVIDVLKASSKQMQGFGYAALIRDAQAFKADINDWLSQIDLPELSLRGQSAIVRSLTDWVNRLESSHARSFSASMQAGVAWILSERIRKLDILPKVEDVIEATITTLYEQKLMTYRGFDPLCHLLRESSSEVTIVRDKACFAQAAALGGLSGDIQVARTSNTLINWQSASDAGRGHKKKELCGRAVGLRYSWDTKTKTFIKRPGVDKLILVVDGTWSQSDLDALIRTGWDEIFYPDEMDKLKAAIV